MSDSNNKTWVEIFMDQVYTDILGNTDLCSKCKKNELDIWTDSGNYCCDCWQEVTSPY